MRQTTRTMRHAIWLLAWLAAPALAGALATVPVVRASGDQVTVAEGAVEAVRQSVVSAQVAGRVTALHVRAGDHVGAGQLLARIDETAAAQQAAASRAQVLSAQAQLDALRKEYERSQQLLARGYISSAAMEKAEAQYKSGAAQAQAMLAQAQAAGTQTQYHFVKAPYAGVVASVDVELGDMAMPGKVLLTLHDPENLRAVVHLPETTAALLRPGASVRLELPAAPAALRMQISDRVSVLPNADPASHTVEVRIALPRDLKSITPGSFVRAYLPTTGAASEGLLVPSRAVIRRTELNAVYVIDGKGAAQLRQVRLGHIRGEQTEVLAGLLAGESVALDPLAAARKR